MAIGDKLIVTAGSRANGYYKNLQVVQNDMSATVKVDGIRLPKGAYKVTATLTSTQLTNMVQTSSSGTYTGNNARIRISPAVLDTPIVIYATGTELTSFNCSAYVEVGDQLEFEEVEYSQLQPTWDWSDSLAYVGDSQFVNVVQTVGWFDTSKLYLDNPYRNELNYVTSDDTVVIPQDGDYELYLYGHSRTNNTSYYGYMQILVNGTQLLRVNMNQTGDTQYSSYDAKIRKGFGTITASLVAGDVISLTNKTTTSTYPAGIHEGTAFGIKQLGVDPPDHVVAEPKQLISKLNGVPGGNYNINNSNFDYDNTYYNVDSTSGQISFLQNGVYTITSTDLSASAIQNLVIQNELYPIDKTTFELIVNDNTRTLDVSFEYLGDVDYTLDIKQTTSDIVGHLQTQHSQYTTHDTYYVIPQYSNMNNINYLFELKGDVTFIERTADIFKIVGFSGYANMGVMSNPYYPDTTLKLLKNGSTEQQGVGDIDTVLNVQVVPNDELSFKQVSVDTEMTTLDAILYVDKGLETGFDIVPVNPGFGVGETIIDLTKQSTSSDYSVSGNVVTFNTDGIYQIDSNWYVDSHTNDVKYMYTSNGQSSIAGLDKTQDSTQLRRSIYITSGSTLTLTLSISPTDTQTWTKAGFNITYISDAQTYITNNKTGLGASSLQTVDNVFIQDLTNFVTRNGAGIVTTTTGITPEANNEVYSYTLNVELWSLDTKAVTIQILQGSNVVATGVVNIVSGVWSSKSIKVSQQQLEPHEFTYRIIDDAVWCRNVDFYVERTGLIPESDDWVYLSNDGRTVRERVATNYGSSPIIYRNTCDTVLHSNTIYRDYTGGKLTVSKQGRYRATLSCKIPTSTADTIGATILLESSTSSTLTEGVSGNGSIVNLVTYFDHVNSDHTIALGSYNNFFVGNINLDAVSLLIERISERPAPDYNPENSVFTVNNGGLNQPFYSKYITDTVIVHNPYKFKHSSDGYRVGLSGTYNLEIAGSIKSQLLDIEAFTIKCNNVVLETDLIGLTSDHRFSININNIHLNAGDIISWDFKWSVQKGCSIDSYFAMFPVDVTLPPVFPQNRNRVEYGVKHTAWYVYQCDFIKDNNDTPETQYDINFTKELRHVLLYEELEESTSTRGVYDDSFSIQVNYDPQYEEMITDTKMYMFVRTLKFTNGEVYEYPYVADTFERVLKNGMWYLTIEGRMKDYITESIVGTNVYVEQQIIPDPLPENFEYDPDKLQVNSQNSNKYIYPSQWNTYRTGAVSHRQLMQTIIENNLIKGYKLGNGERGINNHEYTYSTWRVMANLQGVDVSQLTDTVRNSMDFKPDITIRDLMLEYDSEYGTETTMDVSGTGAGKNDLVIRPKRSVTVELQPYFNDMLEFKHKIDYTKQGVITLRGEGYQSLNASRPYAYRDYMHKIPRPFEVIEQDDKEWIGNDVDKMRRYAYKLNQEHGISPELDFTFVENVCFDLTNIQPGDQLEFKYYDITDTVEVVSITESVTNGGIQFDYVFKGVYKTQ